MNSNFTSVDETFDEEQQWIQFIPATKNNFKTGSSFFLLLLVFLDWKLGHSAMYTIV